MKKFISLMLSATVFLTSTGVGVYAEATTDVFQPENLEQTTNLGEKTTSPGLPANTADFIPGEIPANIIPDASMGEGQHYLGRNNGPIDVSTVTNAGVPVASKWAYSGTSPLQLSWAQRNVFDGIEFNQGDRQFTFDPKASTNYVFRANVKNASPKGITPYVGVNLTDSNWVKYTLDTYGENGMKLTSDWKELKGTIALPDTFLRDGKNPVYTDIIYFGLPAGTAGGAAFYLDVSEKDSIYFAEEARYNITNKIIYQDKTSIAANAELVNQVGLKGKIKQDINWVVTNEDRTEVAEGFTFTGLSTGNNVIIKIENTVEDAKYCLLAYSSDGTMVKGVDFIVGTPKIKVTGVSIDKETLDMYVGFEDSLVETVMPSDATNKNVTWSSDNEDIVTVNELTGVVKAISVGTATITVTTEDGSFKDTCVVTVKNPGEVNPEDYVDFEPSGEKPKNIMDIDETAARTFAATITRNTTDVDYTIPQSDSDWSTDAKYYGKIEAYSVNDITSLPDSYRGFWGLVSKQVVFQKGKTYVFNLDMKAVTEGVKVGVAITNEAADTLVYSNEYGEDGVTLTSELKTYSFTFTPINDAGVLVIGFPAGTPKNSRYIIDTSRAESVYLGEEVVYDIKNELVTPADEVCQNSTITVDAGVVNQGGSKGSLKQNIAWTALSEDKTKEAPGFTFKKNDDGTTSVKIDKSVAVGKYALVVKSTDYEGMLKTLIIDVKKERINDTEFAPSSPYILTLSKTGTTELGVGDSLNLTAKAQTQGGDTAGYLQEFKWFIANEARTEYIEVAPFGFETTENTAKITADEFIKSGTYYIFAEHTHRGNVTKISQKITITVPPIWESAKTLINNGSSSEIAEKLENYAKALEINFVEKFDSQKAAEILKTNLKSALTTEEETKKEIKKAIALSLYTSNPAGVALYDANGDFTYENELSISDMDTAGVTLWKIFKEYINETGKKAVQTEIEKQGYQSFDKLAEFIAPFIIFEAIENPSKQGAGYVSDVLTKENADAAKIDITDYLATTDDKEKTQFNESLAKKSFDATTLAKAIADFEYEEESGTSGGSYTPPSGSKPSVAPITSVKKEEKIFDDVSESHWAYSDIHYLTQREIISGVGYNKFNPEGTLTREQVAKMTAIAFGYSSKAGTTFADVSEGAWYAPYVSTLAGEGIITGIGDNVFGVGKNISRQDLCVILYRAIKNEDAVEMELSFDDESKIADYAKEAVAYFSSYDIVNGFSDNTFRPEAVCTRAQAAKIICKILNIKGATK